jgi:uncharacterized protein (TIGR02145 family)
MRISVLSLAIGCLIQVLQAAALTGNVQDAARKGLSGVVVSLAQSGVATTTDKDGNWALETSVSGVLEQSDYRWSSKLSGQFLELQLPSESDIKIEAFSMGGELLRREEYKRLGAGNHRCPFSLNHSGLVCLRVSANGHTQTLQIGLGGRSGGPTNAIARRAARSLAFSDTLLFTWKSKVLIRYPLTSIPSARILKIIDTTVIPWPSGISYGTMTDSAGQVYRTVVIGAQTWMAENLNYAGATGTVGRCYRDSAHYCMNYGRLYTWAEAMGLDNEYNNKGWYGGKGDHRGICPEGWHVPASLEMSALHIAAKDSTATTDISGKNLKSISGWWKNTGTDAVGFRGLPAGELSGHGSFLFHGDDTNFWQTEEGRADVAYTSRLHYSLEYLALSINYKVGAVSLRCIQNTPQKP